MTFPNWLKMTWWVILLASLTTLLWLRRCAMLSGTSTPFDAVAFVIWIGLMLVPIFSEIKIFGFEFKQKIEELKDHIDQQVTNLRSDIQTSVDVRTQINPQFTIMAPPPDSQLPKIEESIRETVKDYFQAIGVKLIPLKEKVESADDDTLYLFSVRRSLEVELRRICLGRLGEDGPCRKAAGIQMLSSLRKLHIFSEQLIDAVRKVYSVCSVVIHGEESTPEQVRFVKDVAPGLLAALRATE